MNSNSVKEILFSLVIVVVFLTLGIILFSHLEGWSTIDSAYFVVSTAFTVGYGDLVPSPENYVVTSFFMIVACTFVLASSSVVGKGIINIIQDNIMNTQDKKLIIELDERIQEIESSEEVTAEQIEDLKSILNSLENDIKRRKNYQR